MNKYIRILMLMFVVLSHTGAFAQQDEESDEKKDPPKKAKVKIEKMESHKSKRNFRNDEYIRRPKSSQKAENKKLKKQMKEDRERYEDRREDEQHADVTRRMKRNERKADKFNERRSQMLSQSERDANKMKFSLGWMFNRRNGKPELSDKSRRKADQANSTKGVRSQSQRDANKVHFSLGWIFKRGNTQNKGGGEHRKYKGKN